MAEIDPDTLLEWLTIGQGDERDMQLIALEQLCMLLLMSDNVDRCFESCPPRTFLPALCNIFMDDTAPENILEVTARAITYYLDVSAECSRRIVSVEGAVKALCTRLVAVDIACRTSKDLAEQCVKVLELMCTREAGAIYEASGLTSILTFIREYGSMIHKDTLHSAMSVVARLCTKVEPNDSTLEDCVDSLSRLLKHEDSFVADGALRCFACLADRFTRRGVDPAPLAKHGLTDVLLEKLVSSALVFGTEKSMAVPGASPDTRNHSGNVSIIVSVLSTLCRGSPGVTHDLLRSDLLSSLEKAMQGDERCVLDTMRLVDLLLVLLFEGREALPKSTYSSRGSFPGLRRMDSSGERSHRQLIDCIRSKDTDALIEAIDSGAFEVNFMDDVGQTLLNWASAFGTLEMVEFLCERGADVNRGQRSSSLHYAACFGRPAVAKVLLRYGANQDLRDEEGKTPLDKASERNDEGHKEVVRILQSPGEWIAPVNDGEAPKCSEVPKTEKEEPDVVKTEESAVKGDPEMAPIYAQRLLPIFCQTFLSTLVSSIRKATLAIIKKMIHYSPAEVLTEVVMTSAVSTQLVDVISSVLNAEDDEEGHLIAFQCVEDLMTKSKKTFLVHFVRLGVLNKLSEMMTEFERSEDDIASDHGPTIDKGKESIALEDASTIVQGKPYHWHDWCVVRGRDCLYIWSDYCAVELSNGSNGWFRFILDGKLATMYSSGSPEGGSGSSESRSEFLEKLQRAKSQVPLGTPSQPVLSSPTSSRIVVGNWSLSCQKEGTVVINNADGQQATILKEDLPGFVFESNRATKHTFTAETSLGPDFSASWTGKPGRKYQSRREQMKQKVCSVAKNVFEKHFKDAELTNCGALGKVHDINQRLTSASKGVGELTEDQKTVIFGALNDLCQLFEEESMLSTYEIQSSGLVTALFNCLNRDLTSDSKAAKDAIQIFKRVFGESVQEVSGDETMHHISHAVSLVRKLIAVLESSERLPVLSYDGSGSGSGLQVLLRRLRFKLERDPGSTNLVDRSNRFLKMEPLTTIGELEKYLLKMVAKQWYDYERGTFKFIQHFSDSKGPITFQHTHDFDENGIIYWIGTNGKNVADWVNPAQYNLITVTCSEGRSLPYGRVEDILSREQTALNCHTSDDRNAWFTIDFGLWIIPSAYTIRHARGYGRSALRNWLFQGSKDGKSWTTVITHKDDTSLTEPGSTATYPVESIDGEAVGWRMFRIQQAGPNASGQTHYLSLSGFEIYGVVTGVSCEAPGMSTPEVDSSNKKQRRLVRSQMLRQMAIDPKEVTDWKLLRERARQLADSEGVGNSSKNEGWVDVSWVQSTAQALQKLANDEQLNVKVVDISDPDVQATISEVDDRDRESKKNEESSVLFDSKFQSLVRNLSQRDKKENSKKGTDSEVATSAVDEPFLDLSLTSREQQEDPGNENQSSSRGLSVDFANLRLLMAVEDLLGNTSSDLVASALAEAASLDQLREAARNLKGTTGNGKHFPSYQGSRESGSPPDTSEPQEPIGSSNTDVKLIAVGDVTGHVTSSSEDSMADNQENVPLLGRDTIADSTADEDGENVVEGVTGIKVSVTETIDETCVQEPSVDSNASDREAERETNDKVRDDTLKGFASASTSTILGDIRKILQTNQKTTNNDVGIVENNSNSFSSVMPESRGKSELASMEVNETHTEVQKENDKTSLHFETVVVTSSTMKELPSIHSSDRESALSYDIQTASFEPTENLEVNNASGDVEDVQSQRPRRNTVTLDSSEAEPLNVTETVTIDNGSPSQDAETVVEGNNADNNLQDYIVLISESALSSDTNDNTGRTNQPRNVEKTGENASQDSDSVPSKLAKDRYNFVFQSAADSSAQSDDDDDDDDDDVDDEDGEEEDDEADEDLCGPKIPKLPSHLVIVNHANDKLTSGNDQVSNSGGAEMKTPPNVPQSKDAQSTTTATIKSKQMNGKTTVTPSLQTDSFLVDMEEDDMEYFQMEDGDDDDEFDDIENEEEPEEFYEQMNLEAAAEQHAENRRRMWDDEYVLKRQHSALIPAFDPRPGRTNIQQTQDIEVPEKGDSGEQRSEKKIPQLRLWLKGAPVSTGKEIEIPLESNAASIFSYVQKLTFASTSDSGRIDRIRRVWEPVYTIVYGSTNPPEELHSKSLRAKWEVKFVESNLGTLTLSKSEVIRYLQQNADPSFLAKWKISGTARSCRKQRNCSQLVNAYKEFCKIREEQGYDKPADRSNRKTQVTEEECSVLQHRKDLSSLQEVLDLINALHKLNEENNEHVTLSGDYIFDIPADEFLSKKLTNKLVQQIQNPLILASGAWPSWCEYLMMNYPMLFPFETRQMFFQATAFGCSRSIVWLQNTLDAALERARGHQSRRLETHEFRIGRLKQERVKVPRGKELFSFAMRLLDFHAPRKAVLEIEFQDEEGTGLGPSLEFYSLVAHELQLKSLGLWVCDDKISNSEHTGTSGANSGTDLYVHHPNGLFPAPYPQDDSKLDEVAQTFHFLGIFLAKCLQDNRLVDIPLAEPFFKLLCGRGTVFSQPQDIENAERDECSTSNAKRSELERVSSNSNRVVFNDFDLEMIHPNIYRFVKELRPLVKTRANILSDSSLNEEERKQRIHELLFETEHGHSCHLEDLGLTFQYIPPSKSYGFSTAELKVNGCHEGLTIDNVEEYVDLMTDFCLNYGVRRQLEAFRSGFCRVFPIEKLYAFSPREVQLMLSGEQTPKWTREDLLNYTEPKFGYSKESPGFLRLVNVLMDMNGEERKSFLQFATGCSSLPPGGLANLHPRLTVVRKSGEGDGSYPSVNTCVHYLKLPDYSSEEVLKEKLLAATKERGFHLN